MRSQPADEYTQWNTSNALNVPITTTIYYKTVGKTLIMCHVRYLKSSIGQMDRSILSESKTNQ